MTDISNTGVHEPRALAQLTLNPDRYFEQIARLPRVGRKSFHISNG